MYDGSEVLTPYKTVAGIGVTPTSGERILYNLLIFGVGGGGVELFDDGLDIEGLGGFEGYKSLGVIPKSRATSSKALKYPNNVELMVRRSESEARKRSFISDVGGTFGGGIIHKEKRRSRFITTFVVYMLKYTIINIGEDVLLWKGARDVAQSLELRLVIEGRATGETTRHT